MPVVFSICPVNGCRFHNTPMFAEISHTKSHIKSHDYKILHQIAFDLGIINNVHERRSIDWLVDELFKIVRVNAGVALS